MNNLKKIVVVAFLLATTIFYGQRKPDWDKIKTLKIAFITERLNLNSTEAQAFWPIYNDYEAKKQQQREKGHSEIYAKMKDSENLTENQASKLLEKFILFEKEENELEEAFIKKVTKVISPKKTLLLLRSEEDFKRQLIKQYRDKNKGNK
tara:strand:- start:162741 stop:163190 length:450 start_codon:yes stop_codon:yes gene_type:complete